MASKLTTDFFNRDPKIVAKELLGKAIVRKLGKTKLKGKITETEAYYDGNDPASWARFNGKYKKIMEMEAGTILVKMVHNNWLFNIVTSKKGDASAVLIRAIEPLNFNARGKGPGILTKELKINKEQNNKNITTNKEIWIEDNLDNIEIEKSFRIGVKRDLSQKLRFFIKGNKNVSRI